MPSSRLIPKFITLIQEGYSAGQFSRDLLAGLLVGIVALPLAIAFAIASGVKPEQGLYTAIVAGFLISLFSGSRVQIGGPTGAFIVIIYGIVQQYGYDGLVIATFLAGLLLLIMGLARFGTVIKFVPYPVTVGFTTGIALIIFSGQIRDLLGLTMPPLPSHMVAQWAAYGRALHGVNWYAAGIGILALLITIYWPRLVTRRIPGPLIALLVTTAAVALFHWPVDTIGSRFGTVPTSLPTPHWPVLNFDLITKMFSPALSIALLAGIESLLSAVVADGMLGTRHRSNMELIAQGLGNLGSACFGGIPATGAIARTAVNIKNGGRTPVAGIVHAGVLLLILVYFGHWAELIPMPALAAILIVVAYNMSEWHLFVKLLRSPREDVAVLLCTFFLTILIDLVVAIQVGVMLAAVLFMRRMAQASQATYITRSMRDDLAHEEEADDPQAISRKEVPAGVEVFEIYGAFFFGAADKFKDAISQIKTSPKILILRMRHVILLDATAIRALEDVLEKTRREGIVLVLSGVRPSVHHVLERSRLLPRIGTHNVVDHIDKALRRARQILDTRQAS